MRSSTEHSRRVQISHQTDMAIARQRLVAEYGLGNDPDVLFSRADELHTAMRFAECYKITSQCVVLVTPSTPNSSRNSSIRTQYSRVASGPPAHAAASPLLHAPPPEPEISAILARTRDGRQRARRRDQLVRRRLVVFRRQAMGRVAEILRVSPRAKVTILYGHLTWVAFDLAGKQSSSIRALVRHGSPTLTRSPTKASTIRRSQPTRPRRDTCPARTFRSFLSGCNISVSLTSRSRRSTFSARTRSARTTRWSSTSSELSRSTMHSKQSPFERGRDEPRTTWSRRTSD